MINAFMLPAVEIIRNLCNTYISIATVLSGPCIPGVGPAASCKHHTPEVQYRSGSAEVWSLAVDQGSVLART